MSTSYSLHRITMIIEMKTIIYGSMDTKDNIHPHVFHVFPNECCNTIPYTDDIWKKKNAILKC